VRTTSLASAWVRKPNSVIVEATLHNSRILSTTHGHLSRRVFTYSLKRCIATCTHVEFA